MSEAARIRRKRADAKAPDLPSARDQMSRELLRVVADDLEHLTEIAQAERSSARGIREAAGLLYKLLVDNGYIRAWNHVKLPGRPIVACGDLEFFMAPVERDEILYAGLGAAGPSDLWGPRMARKAWAGPRHLRPQPNLKIPLIELPLTKWAAGSRVRRGPVFLARGRRSLPVE